MQSTLQYFLQSHSSLLQSEIHLLCHEFFIPIEGGVNSEKEKEEISKEIEYARGFLNAVSRKLDNPKFVDNAPPKVVESERKKKSDAEMKIKKLQDRLAEIG